MKDQHEKIKGYRDLSPEEIDLMNKVKEAGAALLALHREVVETLHQQNRDKADDCVGMAADSPEVLEMDRFLEAEPTRWAAIAKTDIQTGIMALVRAIAQPGGGV